MLKMSKKEKRLKRKIKKLVKENEKKVRLSSSVIIKDKYIRANFKPKLSKTPRVTSPNTYKNYYFSWSDSKADREGLWSWNEQRQWTDIEYSNTIKLHMDSYINNAWDDVEIKTYNGKDGHRKPLNKYQPLSSICKEARKRWMNLKPWAQFEELFRLRLGSNKRVWGIRIEHHFFLVWYERNHKICPV